MIDLAEMVHASMATEPKPWACNGCRRLVHRAAGVLCARDDGPAHLTGYGFDPAPPDCPRTSPPPLPIGLAS